jgi:hypothetical protein
MDQAASMNRPDRLWKNARFSPRGFSQNGRLLFDCINTMSLNVRSGTAGGPAGGSTMSMASH